MNNLPKVVAQQRRGRASNPLLLDRKSDALPLSHRATRTSSEIITLSGRRQNANESVNLIYDTKPGHHFYQWSGIGHGLSLHLYVPVALTYVHLGLGHAADWQRAERMAVI